MSCIMSSPELLASLARTIEFIGNGEYAVTGFSLPVRLVNALEDCRDSYGCYDADKIYKRLYDMNATAYNTRYAHNELIGPVEDCVPSERPDGKLLVPLHIKYWDGHFVVENIHYDLASCIDFYVYQCCEDATYNTDLYHGMLDFRLTVYSFIVRQSLAYNDSKWGEV